MADAEITQALRELKQATAAQTVAMTQMLGILATQTDMLKEVLKTLTAEPQGESPLQEALRLIYDRLVTVAHTADQIEGKIDRLTVR
jgi:Mg2+ and Co2+ transporter CorA